MNINPDDYWKLRAIASDVERHRISVAMAQQNLVQAEAKRQQLWQEIVTKYELDPNGKYELRDDNCSFNLQEE